MATTIITKNGSGAPVAGNLTEGELALDLTNKKLYSKQGSTVFEVGATGGGASGTFTDLTATSSFTSPGIDDNANATAITIDASEHVGIGTIDPQTLLDLSSATTSTLRISNSDTVLTQGQITGQIEFYQADSTVNGTGITGKIGMKSVPIKPSGGSYYGNAADMGFYVSGDNNGLASDNATLEAMTIAAGGYVGIGVTAPAGLLHVKATESSTGETDPIARFERFTSGDNAYLDITVNNSTNMIGFQSSGSSDGGFTFGGASSDLVTITSAGNVGIGTTDPDSSLVVAGNSSHRIEIKATDTTMTNGADYGGLKWVTNDASNPDLTTWELYQEANGTTGATNLVYDYQGSEKLRINAAGKMALTSNSGGLQLRTGTTGQDGFIDWQFNSTSTNFVRMGIDYDTRATTGWMVDSGYPITLDYTTSLVFKSGGTEKARLDVDGNLLVGHSSTGAPATDYGSNIYATGQIYSYTSSPGSSDMYRGYNIAGTLAYSIKANGTVYSVSDRVLKENIVDSESALAIVNDIKVRSFDWREDGDHVSHGFIAQELNEAYPEAAAEPIEDQVHWSVDYTRLVPVLTKALQEQQAMIEELKAEVAALKGAN